MGGLTVVLTSSNSTVLNHCKRKIITRNNNCTPKIYKQTHIEHRYVRIKLTNMDRTISSRKINIGPNELLFVTQLVKLGAHGTTLLLNEINTATLHWLKEAHSDLAQYVMPAFWSCLLQILCSGKVALITVHRTCQNAPYFSIFNKRQTRSLDRPRQCVQVNSI